MGLCYPRGAGAAVVEMEGAARMGFVTEKPSKDGTVREVSPAAFL